MSKILDYLTIVILSALIILSPWQYGSVSLEARYFIHLAGLAILLAWLIKKNLTSRQINYYPLYLPLIFFLAIAILSIVFSIYRYASILGALDLLSYLIIFFIVLETVNTKRRLGLFIWLINIAGVFYCLYGILQYCGYLPKGYWAESSSLSSRFVNSGSFGAFINAGLFLAIGAAFSYKKAVAKIIFLLFSGIFFAGLILTKSRISWIVFLPVMILFAVLSLKRRKPLKLRGFIFIVIFAIIFIYVLLHYKALIWQRLYVAVPTQFQSLRQRLDVWKGTMRIISEHPFGTGIGTFQYIYPSYRMHSDRFFVDYAHSDYLQIAGELGIAGLALFAWFIGLLLIRALKALSKIPPENFFIAAGLICALLSLNLQALVDFPLHIPANAILFFIIIALLIKYISYEKPKPILLNKYINTAVILIIICAGLFTNIYLSKKYYLQAKEDSSNMNWQEALSGYDRSIKLMPLDADTYAARGGIYALKAALTFPPQKIQYQNFAVSGFLKAAKLNPYKSEFYLNLAWLYADSRKHKEAMRAFNKAIETNPTNGEYYYSYADYCLEHNLLSEALKTYRKALSLFINDDGRFARLYGSIYGLFDKIYGYTQEYSQLKSAVPGDKLDIRLLFADFLESKKMISDAYTEYEDILKNYPGNDTARKALERLRRG